MRESLELDEPPPIPELVIRRVCLAKGCRATARAGGGKLCRAHHAAAMRKWRAERRKAVVKGQIGTPEKPASSSPTATPTRNAWIARRVALKDALDRKKFKAGPCVGGCGNPQVRATFETDPDPAATGLARFAGVVWLCRGCRHTYLNRAQREAAERAAAIADAESRARYARSLESAVLTFEQLPPDVQRTLTQQAQIGPRGMRLNTESPLFKQRLAKLVEEHFAQMDGVSSSQTPSA